MVVVARRVDILVREPVQGLQQLARIGPERRRSGRGLLALVLLRGGLRGLPRRFLLRGPGRQLRLRVRSQAFAVAHDGHFLRLRVPAPHDALPLRVERVVRHVLIRADGEDDITPGGHLAEQAAHFQVVVRAGAVGIEEHGNLAVLIDISLEVLRAVDRVRGKGGVLHGHGLPGAGSAAFDDLFLLRLREADRARGEHRRRIGRHPQLEPPEGEGHRQPEEKELAEEKRDSLAPERAFQGGEGRFVLGVHLLRVLVQMQIDPALLDRGQRIFHQRISLCLMGILIIIGLHVRVRSEILPPLLGRLQEGCDQGEERVEDNERGQGREVPLVITLDVVPDHITGTQEQVRERTDRILVQEGDVVERPFVEIAGMLPGRLLLRPMPGEIPQLLPDGEGAAARLERMFLFLVHR